MTDDRDLAGSVALVTGASRGIGRCIAERLHHCGAVVALVSSTQGDLDAVVGSLGSGAVAIRADLRKEDELLAAADRAAEELGPVTILVNDAGVCHPRPLGAITTDLLAESWELNVRAPILLTQCVAPGMEAAGGGSIINVSSVLAEVGFPNRADYAGTKGALESATRALAAELGCLGIRVNAVAPSFTRTPMTEKTIDDPAWRAGYLPGVPLGRIADPDDVADLVRFLASDESRYITGQCIAVDGGWSTTRPRFR